MIENNNNNKLIKFQPMQKSYRIKVTFRAKVTHRTKVIVRAFLTPTDILYTYSLYVSFKLCSLNHIIREI